jgi:ribonuclease R
VFLSKRVGEEFEAYVSGVTAFGLFVVLSDIYVEGLVPMDALEDDFYRYEDGEHRLVGTSTGRVFRLGDVLRVKLITADFDRRQLAFKPIGHSAGMKSKSRVEAIARNTARRTPRTPPARTGTRKAAPKKGRRR